MNTTQQASRADQVRHFVLERLIEPGRAAGKRTVTVRAGDVQRELGWWNRVPSVCSALDAQEFLRMSRTRLVQRRGPMQSTTAEWEFALSEDPKAPDAGSRVEMVSTTGDRRLVAVWDGASFRPVIAPENLESGQRVVLTVSPKPDARDLAGEFGSFVGSLSEEESVVMQEAMESAFEAVSHEW